MTSPLNKESYQLKTPNKESYQTCKIEEHTNQPLNIICTYDSCSNNGLICADCMSLNHSNHINKCISLQVFLNKVKKHYFVSKEAKEIEIKQFYNDHQENLKSINRTLTNISSILEELAKSQVDFFNQGYPELERLLTEEEEAFLCTATSLEKRNFSGTEEFLKQFIKNLISTYQIDSVSFNLFKFRQEANFNKIDSILKESKKNLQYAKNYVDKIDNIINERPNLKKFRNERTLNLKVLSI